VAAGVVIGWPSRGCEAWSGSGVIAAKEDGAMIVWSNSATVAVIRQKAADGEPAIRVPLMIQFRSSEGVTLYRWKECCGRDHGDSSPEFYDRAQCVADAKRHAEEASSA
jgi:hypothetical protein